MQVPPRLFVYDDSVELTEVLEAVYEPRGLCVERIRSNDGAPAQEHSGNSIQVMASGASGLRSTGSGRCVVIGRFGFEDCDTQPGHADSRYRLRSPFHFRDLISAIDQLLDSGD